MLIDWPKQLKHPQKSNFMMKGWQNRGVIGQVSPKTSWQQTNYEEREGKNAYKKRRSAIEEGI